MNKYDFIADLLEKEKLDPSQKERVLKLIVNELKNDGINQIEIEERIKKIEQKLIPQIPLERQSEKVNNSTLPTDLPHYIDPKQLTQFLKAYNQDPILKYSCHDFDDDGLQAINYRCEIVTFNLEKYQYLLANSFKSLSSQYILPKHIWALINAYLNGGQEWASDKVKINWKSPELLEWSKNNPGIVPNPGKDLIIKVENHGFEFNNLAFRSKMFDKRISSFSDLVIYFKSLFHIKSDNSLVRLIRNVNKPEDWDSKFNLDYSKIIDNIEFFTDVDKLLQAYVKILKIILEITEKHKLDKPDVNLSLKEIDNCVIFSIHHTNSKFKKTIKNTLERPGQWETELIKNQINGMCDLYILADFENNDFAKINLWNGEERKAEKINNFSGVEFQLILK